MVIGASLHSQVCAGSVGRGEAHGLVGRLEEVLARLHHKVVAEVARTHVRGVDVRQRSSAH
jgi:hypothetical protein